MEINVSFPVTESEADADRWSCNTHQLCQGEGYDSHGGSCTTYDPTHDTKGFCDNRVRQILACKV